MITKQSAMPLGMVVLGAVLLPEASVHANIDLEWRPATQDVLVGDTVRLGLYAVSDSDLGQTLSAMNVIIAWDPVVLTLQGIDDTGGATLSFSGFPADPYHLNESDPPADGDALYVAFAELGQSVAATPEGTLITTFVFLAQAATPQSAVAILDHAGNPPTDTIVYDGEHPNRDVTGELGSAVIMVRTADCPQIIEHVLKYNRNQQEIVSKVHLDLSTQRRWAVSASCTGPLGEQLATDTVGGNRKAVLRFAFQGLGTYTATVVEITDDTGQARCVGRFEEVTIVVR